MSLFTWSLAVAYPLLVILDLYYNWDRIGVKEEQPPQPKPILQGSDIYNHKLLRMTGIKDPATDYEVITHEEREPPVLVTSIEYYNDSRGERKYRTIHI